MKKQLSFLLVVLSVLLFSCKEDEINYHEGIMMNTYFAELPISTSQDSIFGHWFAKGEGFVPARTECIITRDTLYVPVKKALPIKGWSKNADGIVCHLEGRKITFWGKDKVLLVTDPDDLFFVENGLVSNAGYLVPADIPVDHCTVKYLDGSTNHDE